MVGPTEESPRDQPKSKNHPNLPGPIQPSPIFGRQHHVSTSECWKPSWRYCYTDTTRREATKTVTCKQRLFFTGAVARQCNKLIPRRLVMIDRLVDGHHLAKAEQTRSGVATEESNRNIESLDRFRHEWAPMGCLRKKICGPDDSSSTGRALRSWRH